MRRALALFAAAALAGPAGCTGDPPPAPPPSPEAVARAETDRVVRGWTEATAAGDFRRAGRFFAPGAVVEQFGREARLNGAEGGEEFSAGLACRARVTAIAHERGAAVASFALSTGRTGLCTQGGSARVRFVVERGLIREWRQLPEPGQEPPPERQPDPGRSPGQVS